MIRLPVRERYLERGIIVPGSVWREPPFKFDPHSFGISSPRLEEKIYSPEDQIQSLNRFCSDPASPAIYGVGSAPSDSRAKMFAAYLTSIWMHSTHGSSTALWVSAGLFATSESFKDAFFKKPDLLVVSGLSPNSSNYKLEAVHELLSHHEDIPRILVISGEDPISFAYGRLFCSIHNLYFHSTNVVKRKVQVI